MADRITLVGTTIQMPTTHGWVYPSPIGTGGRGNIVIPIIYKYGMNWDFMLPEDFNILRQLQQNNTNVPVSAYLPEIGNASYSFKTYTCIIDPITYRNYYEGSYQEVSTQLIGIDITLP